MKYAVESLAAGFIGLGFREDPGDLTKIDKGDLEGPEKNYWRFAHEMNIGDAVLVIVHHFPFAVLKVEREYNYLREPVSDLGVWFRHFRPVEDVHYFADHNTNAKEWEQIPMTDTVSPLRREETDSYQLIEEML